MNHYCLAETEIVFSKKFVDNLYSRDESKFKHNLSRFIENIFLIKKVKDTSYVNLNCGYLSRNVVALKEYVLVKDDTKKFDAFFRLLEVHKSTMLSTDSICDNFQFPKKCENLSVEHDSIPFLQKMILTENQTEGFTNCLDNVGKGVAQVGKLAAKVPELANDNFQKIENMVENNNVLKYFTRSSIVSLASIISISFCLWKLFTVEEEARNKYIYGLVFSFMTPFIVVFFDQIFHFFINTFPRFIEYLSLVLYCKKRNIIKEKLSINTMLPRFFYNGFFSCAMPFLFLIGIMYKYNLFTILTSRNTRENAWKLFDILDESNELFFIPFTIALPYLIEFGTNVYDYEECDFFKERRKFNLSNLFFSSMGIASFLWILYTLKMFQKSTFENNDITRLQKIKIFIKYLSKKLFFIGLYQFISTAYYSSLYFFLVKKIQRSHEKRLEESFLDDDNKKKSILDFFIAGHTFYTFDTILRKINNIRERKNDIDAIDEKMSLSDIESEINTDYIIGFEVEQDKKILIRNFYFYDFFMIFGPEYVDVLENINKLYESETQLAAQYGESVIDIKKEREILQEKKEKIWQYFEEWQDIVTASPSDINKAKEKILNYIEKKAEHENNKNEIEAILEKIKKLEKAIQEVDIKIIEKNQKIELQQQIIDNLKVEENKLLSKSLFFFECGEIKDINNSILKSKKKIEINNEDIRSAEKQIEKIKNEYGKLEKSKKSIRNFFTTKEAFERNKQKELENLGEQIQDKKKLIDELQIENNVIKKDIEELIEEKQVKEKRYEECNKKEQEKTIELKKLKEVNEKDNLQKNKKLNDEKKKFQKKLAILQGRVDKVGRLLDYINNNYVYFMHYLSIQYLLFEYEKIDSNFFEDQVSKLNIKQAGEDLKKLFEDEDKIENQAYDFIKRYIDCGEMKFCKWHAAVKTFLDEQLGKVRN